MYAKTNKNKQQKKKKNKTEKYINNDRTGIYPK